MPRLEAIRTMPRRRRTVVVDASTMLAIVREEMLSGTVAADVRSFREQAADLVVPALFWLEVTNILLRRHRFSGQAVVAALHQLDEVGLRTADIDRPLVLLALDRAERFGLTSHDAAYLVLAEVLDAELYSNDRALLGAAGVRGVRPGGRRGRLSETPRPYELAPTWPEYHELASYLGRLRADAKPPVGSRRDSGSRQRSSRPSPAAASRRQG